MSQERDKANVEVEHINDGLPREAEAQLEVCGSGSSLSPTPAAQTAGYWQWPYIRPPEYVSDRKARCFIAPFRNMNAFKVEGRRTAIFQIPAPMGVHESVDTFEMIQTEVNYDEMREWMSMCVDAHGDTCGMQKDPVIPGLLAIDCLSRTVVGFPDEGEYAALSYPWGKQTEETFSPVVGKPLPGKLPRTIEDAMLVLRQLRLRYLWVDRYCIDQTDEVQKHNLIRQMDRVYSCAAVTIVAAAGDDPEYGLPGVSTRPRLLNGCRSRVSGDVDFFSHSPGSEFIESAVAHRGWTYQEGLLARRRLLFMPSQVVFQCRTSMDRESCSVHRQRESLPPGGEYYGVTLYYSPFPRRQIADDFPGVGIWDRINEYCPRVLSFPSDTLNAFLGILRAYERRSDGSAVPVHHVWGLPIVGCSPPALLTSFTLSLLWGMSKVTTYFNLPNRRVRTPGLPSWSWAGWRGFRSRNDHAPYTFVQRIYLRYDDTRTTLWGPVPGIKVECCLRDGTRVGLASYQTQARFGRVHFSELDQCIYVPGWTTRFRSVIKGHEVRITPEGGGADTFPPSGGEEDITRPNFTTDYASYVPGCTYIALVITWPPDPEEEVDLDILQRAGFALALEPTGADSFCRVGTVSFHLWNMPLNMRFPSEPQDARRVELDGWQFDYETLRLV